MPAQQKLCEENRRMRQLLAEAVDTFESTKVRIAAVVDELAATTLELTGTIEQLEATREKLTKQKELAQNTMSGMTIMYISALSTANSSRNMSVLRPLYRAIR